jgi:ribosome biogenesis GTPase
MGKQQLNKRQLLAIKKQQAKKRQRAEQPNDDLTGIGAAQTGLLIAHYGQYLEVEDHEDQVHRCVARKNLGSIAVGDRVIWHREKQGANVIVAVEPRQSELFRYNKFEGNKLVVANIDQLYIVVSIEPPRAMNVIDRYIMLAELQHITPIIVFNKIDLLNAEQESELKQFFSYYQQLGYQVFYTSTTNTIGIEMIQHSLHHHVSVFVGLSGVGKSSLVKTLLPDQAIEIGELSARSREGNHTTTTAKLFHLPDGGNVIDCPGIRELAIGELTPQQILHGFKELAELATQCQFRNCSHTHEPGCAILAALENPGFNKNRLASYQNILNENESYGKAL